MAQARTPPCVAVFNSSDEILEMLRSLIEQAGFAVVTGHTFDIKSTKLDLLAVIEQHDPIVIVYDIAPPYDRNWQFLEHLRQRPPLAGRRFVVTTTNAAHLGEIVGRDAHVYEIVGKPLDLETIVRAVKEASRSRIIA